MAADDRTSQDAAVIGDDLVEALGFEPISSESSEVAVLSEVELDDNSVDRTSLDEVDEPIVDDIEILDDPVADNESASDPETLDPETLDPGTLDGDSLDGDGLDGGPTASEPDEVDVADSDLAEIDVADSDLAEIDVSDIELAETDSELSAADIELSDTDASAAEVEDDGSLFGAPAPWPSKAIDEADTISLDTLNLETGDTGETGDDTDSDADSSDAEPVVFFNNGVDTDTAPLADLTAPGEEDLDEVESELTNLEPGDSDADGDTSETETGSGSDGLDLESVDLESDDVGAALAERDDDLIDLDGPGADDVDPDSLLDDDLAEDEPSIDLTEADAADLGSADLGSTDEAPVESEAVSLLEAPVAVPGPPTSADLVDDGLVENLDSETTEIVAPELEPAIVAAPSRVKTRKKLRARKSRRVIRHIDPWSVLTFSVLFHLCFFAALLLASVLVWNAALAAGTIENIENFIRELGDYETFEINSDQVFRAAALIAGLLTLASSVLVVLLTVVFNLISDLIGGIRVTVIEEETVRIPTTAKK